MSITYIIYKDKAVVCVFGNVESAVQEVLRLQKEFPISEIEKENWYTDHPFDVYRH